MGDQRSALALSGPGPRRRCDHAAHAVRRHRRGGVYKSTDGGGSWAPANTGLTTPFILSIAVDPTSSAIVYTGTNGGGVFKSIDGGASWAPANTGLGDLNGLDLAIDPTSATTLYVGTFSGVLKSTDGAGSWSAASTGITDPNVFGVALDPTAPSTVYASTNGGGIFKTTNGGTSWAPASVGLTNLLNLDVAIDPTTPSTLYAATSGAGVFKSTDGAGTWSPANFGIETKLVNQVAVDPSGPSRVFAGMVDGVVRSANGGAGWQLINTGLTNTFIQALAFEPTTPTRLYLGTSPAAVGGVYFYEPYCQDGILDPGEGCEDLNVTPGDGCDTTCQVEVCFACAGEPSVCVPDDGASCSDGDLCTTGDLCAAGVCTGTPVTCASCARCDTGTGSCIEAPRTGCRQPALPLKAKLLLKDGAPDTRDLVVWSWLKGMETTVGDFGDPEGTDQYDLCIYDDLAGTTKLVLRASAPAGEMCGANPCWKALNGMGFRYLDPERSPDGLLKVLLKPGEDERARVLVKGKGASLLDPPAPALPLELPARVQLQAENGECWEADYGAAGMLRNDPTQFKGKAGP